MDKNYPSTNFSEPENLKNYFKYSLGKIISSALELDGRCYTDKTNRVITGIISRANELDEFADIITDYHSDSELKEREGPHLPPDTMDHKVQAIRLGDNILAQAKEFKQVLNNYEILGTLEIVKAKILHDIGKLADAKEIIREKRE
jgi:hypothetical protein